MSPLAPDTLGPDYLAQQKQRLTHSGYMFGGVRLLGKRLTQQPKSIFAGGSHARVYGRDAPG